MSTPIYFTTLGLILGTIVTVFGMRAFSAYMQAKARMDSGEAYRLLAEKVQESLAEIRSRLASVEKILKEVE